MDYQHSPKTWSTSSSPTFTYSSSSTYSLPDETPTIKYFSELANTKKPYVSPYANENTSSGSSRSQARSASVLSTSNLRSLETNMSTYSASSQSSSTYSSPRSTKNAMSSGASSSKKMSSVSLESMSLLANLPEASSKPHDLSSTNSLLYIQRIVHLIKFCEHESHMKLSRFDLPFFPLRVHPFPLLPLGIDPSLALYRFGVICALSDQI